MQVIEIQWNELTTTPLVADDSQSVTLRCLPLDGVLAANLQLGGEDLGSPTVRLGQAGWEWQWQPRGRVGRFDVRLDVQGTSQAALTLRSTLVVGPGKLDPDAYEYLLAAIQRVAVGLVLDFTGGKTAAVLDDAVSGPRSIVEEYWTRLVLETNAAVATAEQLQRNPYGTWHQEVHERELHELDGLNAETLARIAERPLEETDLTHAADLANRFRVNPSAKPRLPRSLPVRTMVPTVQRYEHAVMVRVLLELHARCVWIREAIGREIAWRSGGIVDSSRTAQVALLREWQRKVNIATVALMRVRGGSTLADIEPVRAWKGPTELMRRDRRYRVVAQTWKTLWQRPFVAVNSPAFELPVDDLPALYERWCLLEVAHVLASLGEPIDQHLFASQSGAVQGVGPTVWNLRLAEDRPIVRRRRANGDEVRLWYHRRFAPHAGQGAQLGSLDPFLRVPDIVIEVVRQHAPPRLIIFDAKYRLTATGNLGEDVMEAAYAYHGGLGYGGIPVSVGTFVLFPGAEGFEAGGVGAVPMIPGAPSSLAEIIRIGLGASD